MSPSTLLGAQLSGAAAADVHHSDGAHVIASVRNIYQLLEPRARGNPVSTNVGRRRSSVSRSRLPFEFNVSFTSVRSFPEGCEATAADRALSGLIDLHRSIGQTEISHVTPQMLRWF